jgi:hypothetical protein
MAAGQFAQGAHLFGVDELLLGGAQLLIGGPQAAEQPAAGDGRPQQVSDQVEQLDLFTGEPGRPCTHALQDADRLLPGPQRRGEETGGPAGGQLVLQRRARGGRRITHRRSLGRGCQVRVQPLAVAQAPRKGRLVHGQPQPWLQPQGRGPRAGDGVGGRQGELAGIRVMHQPDGADVQRQMPVQLAQGAVQDQPQVQVAGGRLGHAVEQPQLGQQVGFFKQTALLQPGADRLDGFPLGRPEPRLARDAGQVEHAPVAARAVQRQAQERAEGGQAVWGDQSGVRGRQVVQARRFRLAQHEVDQLGKPGVNVVLGALLVGKPVGDVLDQLAFGRHQPDPAEGGPGHAAG